jgi:hypothetical protein
MSHIEEENRKYCIREGQMGFVKKSQHRRRFNPILHTVWLDNHALTLKVILENIISVGNPVFAHLPATLFLIKENLSQV